jgi:hypothetical protein
LSFTQERPTSIPRGDYSVLKVAGMERLLGKVTVYGTILSCVRWVNEDVAGLSIRPDDTRSGEVFSDFFCRPTQSTETSNKRIIMTMTLRNIAMTSVIALGIGSGSAMASCRGDWDTNQNSM